MNAWWHVSKIANTVTDANKSTIRIFIRISHYTDGLKRYFAARRLHYCSEFFSKTLLTH